MMDTCNKTPLPKDQKYSLHQFTAFMNQLTIEFAAQVLDLNQPI